MKSLYALPLILTGALLQILTVHAGVTDDLAPCVVFLMQEVPASQEAIVGSGFLVHTDNAVFLVTASHVARALGTSWRIVMPGGSGRAVTARANGLEWRESPTADVSVAVLKPDSADQLNALLKRSLPIHLLSARPLPPSRDIPLTVMGYPLGLGSSGYVSPLSLETKAASGFITLKRFDNGKEANFIVLQDPSIGGLSGGPVFDTGKSYFEEGRRITVREGVSVVGLIHGVISDKSGGKFAAVVPAIEIVRLLSTNFRAE